MFLAFLQFFWIFFARVHKLLGHTSKPHWCFLLVLSFCQYEVYIEYLFHICAVLRQLNASNRVYPGLSTQCCVKQVLPCTMSNITAYFTYYYGFFRDCLLEHLILIIMSKVQGRYSNNYVIPSDTCNLYIRLELKT